MKVGKDGKDGVSITGPDTANGTDGKVAVTGKDGKEAVSISGKNGVGHIGLNGKDGRSADISVEKVIRTSTVRKSLVLNTLMKTVIHIKWQPKMMVWHTVVIPVMLSRKT